MMDKPPRNQTCRSSISHCSNLLFINPFARSNKLYIQRLTAEEKKNKENRRASKILRKFYFLLWEFSVFFKKKKDSKNYPHLSLLFPKENNKYSINVSRRSSKISLSFLSTNTWFLSLHNPPPSPWNNNKYIKACELLARRVSKFPVKRYIQCWAGKIEQFFRILFTTAPSPSHSPLSLSLYLPFPCRSTSIHLHC